MKSAMLLLLLSGVTFAQAIPAAKPSPVGLRVELRTSSARVKMNDEIQMSVFFRSPDETRTIWNALWWGGSTGLELQVLDSGGHQVEHAVVPIEPIPPDLTGKDALISIEGSDFAGFDSEFAVKDLFPHPVRTS